ncbi:MAG TPA: SDR family oxidoreductase, partial [Cystobacter sp.]
MKLQGKVALITGADSGIGQATAEVFAREGASVGIIYHSDEQGAQETRRLVEAYGRRAIVLQGDVGDSASVAKFFERTVAELGVLDILVNNAGQGMGGKVPVDELEDAQFEKILRVNLMGPVFCARAFIKLRKQHGGKGRIVNISSVAQHLPTPDSAPYGMSKAGLGSFTRSLSVELAP